MISSYRNSYRIRYLPIGFSRKWVTVDIIPFIYCKRSSCNVNNATRDLRSHHYRTRMKDAPCSSIQINDLITSNIPTEILPHTAMSWPCNYLYNNKEPPNWKKTQTPWISIYSILNIFQAIIIHEPKIYTLYS